MLQKKLDRKEVEYDDDIIYRTVEKMRKYSATVTTAIIIGSIATIGGVSILGYNLIKDKLSENNIASIVRSETKNIVTDDITEKVIDSVKDYANNKINQSEKRSKQYTDNQIKKSEDNIINEVGKGFKAVTDYTNQGLDNLAKVVTNYKDQLPSGTIPAPNKKYKLPSSFPFRGTYDNNGVYVKIRSGEYISLVTLKLCNDKYLWKDIMKINRGDNKQISQDPWNVSVGQEFYVPLKNITNRYRNQLQ